MSRSKTHLVRWCLASSLVAWLWLSVSARAADLASVAHRTNPVPAVSTDLRASLYLRATNVIGGADFFKPSDQSDPDLTFKLAPLIMQEIKGVAHRDWFGALSFSNGVVQLAPDLPTVYVSIDSVSLSGRELPRFTYLWCYAPTNAPGNASPAVGIELQGIRLTLDSTGLPAVWEVLTDPSRMQLIFVAQHLESAALAEFGKPLPGRRYAVERAAAETPDVLVARVIEDGPVPMGPFVYLEAGTHAVSTVICRCMPSQATNLLQTKTYVLTPSALAGNGVLLAKVRALSETTTAFWPGEQASEPRLARCLRLPSKL